MRLAQGQVRLAISIPAHEELETLLAQVRNLRWFCDAPLIALHLDQAAFAAIEEEAGQRRLLRLLEEEHGALVNPHHGEAGPGHVLRAHLSNFALLAGRGEAFTHFVMLTPDALFVRFGVEAYLRGLDASAPLPSLAAPGDAAAPWAGDARFLALLAARGIGRVARGPHAGGFYARALMESLARALERHFPDWDQGASWPREEFILPTLLQEQAGARLGPGLAHALGTGAAPERDRRAVAQALRELGVIVPEGEKGLDRWAAALLATEREDALAGRFVLAGIPRAPGHPLRLLLELGAAPGGARPARQLARRLAPGDLRRLDGPDTPAAPSGRALLTPALGRGVHDLILAACPGGEAPLQPVTEGLWAGAAHLPGPGARARIVLRPGSLLSLAAPSLAEAGEAACFFVAFEVPRPAPGDAALRLVLAPDSPAPRALCLEVGGTGGKRAFALGPGVPAGEDGRARLYPLPPELLAPGAWPDGPRMWLRISQGFGPPGCRIASLGFVAVEGAASAW
jgi:hypothetical protein